MKPINPVPYIAMLILGILAVGNFTRDQKSNYLEGFLCLAIYSAIAVAAFFVSARHRLPLLVPLCVTAGGAIDALARAVSAACQGSLTCTSIRPLPGLSVSAPGPRMVQSRLVPRR